MHTILDIVSQYAWAIILALLVCTVAMFFFFARSPHLHKAHTFDSYDPISVIITVNNRERELPALFADLHNQILPPIEIVCVDIGSSDRSMILAKKFGARAITLNTAIIDERDYEACAREVGASFAKGKMLVFLDAGVRMAPGALLSLSQASRKNKAPLSIQPYHLMRRAYEHIAAFVYLFPTFNQGLAFSTRPKARTLGLYTSIVLFTKDQWQNMHKELANFYISKSAKTDATDEVASILLGDKSVLVPNSGEYSISTNTPEYSAKKQYAFAYANGGVHILKNQSLHIKHAAPSGDSVVPIRSAPASQPATSTNFAIPLDVYTYSIPSGSGGKIGDANRPAPQQFTDIEDVLFGIESKHSSLRTEKTHSVKRTKRETTHWKRIFGHSHQELRLLRGGFLMRFRLIPDGFISMCNDCINELAYQNPPPSKVRTLEILTLTLMACSPIMIILGIAFGYNWMLGIGAASYLGVSMRLNGLLTKIGKYSSWVYLFFPIPLAFYFIMSILAFFKKIKEPRY